MGAGGFLGLGALLAAALAGCGGHPLSPPPDDAGAAAPDTGPPPRADAGAPEGRPPQPGADGAAGADGGVAADAGSDGTGSAICPAGSPAGSPPADTPALPPSSFVRHAATQVPFACDPLPPAFFFPPPGPDVPGLYSRYASYEVGDATSVAPSPDGRLAALATRDGIVRVVELASSRVVGVLARPRASLNLVAFSPSGDTLLTVARGPREVTSWRASDLAALWTVVLPGHTYDNTNDSNSIIDVGFTPGGLAFSPDGASAVVSPGRGLYRLDVTTGALLAAVSPASTNPDFGLVVSDVGYGWGGRRVLATVPSLAAHCQHAANGGRVVTFDAATLTQLHTVADWGAYPMVTGQPAFRASPTADYVLVPAGSDAPGVRAFRVSDGASLPAPPLAAFPLAFMPTGDSVLVAAVPPDAGPRDGARELQVVRLADGVVQARTSATPDDTSPRAVAVSGDGAAVTLAGRGPALLRTWNPGAGDARAVCSTEPRPATAESTRLAPAASLAANASALALGWGSEVRVLDPAGGRRLATFAAGGTDTAAVQLSPDGRYVLARPYDFPMLAPVVFRMADGARVAELAPPRYWQTTLFSPDDHEVLGSYFAGSSMNGVAFDLMSGREPRAFPLTQYGDLVGFSGGCLVVQDQVLGIFRSCASCTDDPFAPGSWAARISPDGRLLATLDANAQNVGVTVYRMPPEQAVVRKFPARTADQIWGAVDYPVAVSPGPGGGRVLLSGAPSFLSCYTGPQFELGVYDLASGALLDALPPGMPATDAGATTLAYGAQIWRAR